MIAAIPVPPPARASMKKPLRLLLLSALLATPLAQAADMSAVKQRLGVAPRLRSCHTAVIDGKFVEGHVPAEQVLALRKRDDLLGIAAPGMPMGSPGMEMDGHADAYQVIGVSREGNDAVVADYPAH